MGLADRRRFATQSVLAFLKGKVEDKKSWTYVSMLVAVWQIRSLYPLLGVSRRKEAVAEEIDDCTQSADNFLK